MEDLEPAVLAVLRSLVPGEVVTYGEVAADAGWPGRARAVGNILRWTDEPVPWWRVVNASGRLVPGNEQEQAKRLRAEGVPVVDGQRVPLSRIRSDSAGHSRAAQSPKGRSPR
jgi:methylated-DNA-protein-cysteine methyltransferase related protein